MSNSLQEIVNYFCALDIPLLPCHGILDGKCTCRKGNNCPSPGKHPLMAKWQMIASTDPKKVMSWLGGKKPVNLALSTGRKSSVVGKFLVVADGDLVSHPFLQRLARHSTTVTQRSGGGGDHALYWSSVPVKNSCQLVDEKMDIRGSGGIVVIAPSTHKSGKKYEFTCDLKTTTIQDVPDFLGKKLQIAVAAKTKAKEQKTPGPVAVVPKETSELTKLWQSMSVSMIRDKMAMGMLIPCGVRNATMHRLLSSDRARGVATKAKLMTLALKYLGCFEDPTSFELELEGIVNSVSRYPAYNNSFEKVNELYLGWLAKNGHKVHYELDTLEAFDKKFFDTLKKTSELEMPMTLQEVSACREEFLKSQGLVRFATYKSQLLAKKLLSLGFLKRRTRKGNFWMIKIGVQTTSPEPMMKVKPPTQPLETLNMAEELKDENKKKGLKDGDIIDYNGHKVRVELIKTQVPVKQHSREHLYMGSTGYDYNKAMMALLSRLSEEQMDLLERNELVMDREKTLAWMRSVKPGDIIGVKCNRYKVLPYEKRQEPGVELPVISVNHVHGKPGEFRPFPDACASVFLTSEIDHARELGLLDILWRNKKPYGESATEDMTIVLLHDVEEISKTKKVKKKS